MDLGSEFLDFSDALNTEKQMKLYPKMTSRLGNTSLEQNIRLKASGYLLFIAAIFFYCLAAHDQFLVVIEKTVLLTHRVHPLLSAA